MNNRPYGSGWLPVSQAAKALQNQADTIFDELNLSLDRAQAIRAKMDFRAKQKAWHEAREERVRDTAAALHALGPRPGQVVLDDCDGDVYVSRSLPATRSSLDEYRYGMSNFGMPVRQVSSLPVGGMDAQQAVDSAAFAAAMLFGGLPIPKKTWAEARQEARGARHYGMAPELGMPFTGNGGSVR